MRGVVSGCSIVVRGTSAWYMGSTELGTDWPRAALYRHINYTHTRRDEKPLELSRLTQTLLHTPVSFVQVSR
jgi:hypothetical protein